MADEYRCEACDINFDTKEKLKQHKKEKHGG